MYRSWILLTVPLMALALFPSQVAASNEPHWIRVDSDHFSVITDADEKKAHDVIARFEQMRAEFAQLLYKSRINMSEPIDIIAFRSEDEYENVTPARQGAGLSAAFCIPGKDRYFFVLNLSQNDSWRAISRNFVQLLLNYNYPPTQSWFDDGFTAYFSSLRLSDKQMQIGGDPSENEQFTNLLQKSTWLSLPELFGSNANDRAHQPLSEAESWILMHYLLSNQKLPAAGAYFGAVENEKLPVEEAIQKAFGVSSDQLQKAIQDYFRQNLPQIQAESNSKPLDQNAAPAPVTADVIGTSTHEMPPGYADTLVAEMSLRIPEHRDVARNQLESVIANPKMDNPAAHRAVAWDAMQKKDYDHAVEELGNAIALDNKDPMTHYYLALYKFQQARTSGQEVKGLANMMQDLHYVLDWDHQFAEAYYMLAVAQTEGGGLRAATDSIRAAMQLSPRRTDYVLELARIYEDAKSWDAATALLQRLSQNSDTQIASAAQKDLHDLPYIKKYGVPPTDSAAAENPKVSASSGSAAATAPSTAAQRTAARTAPQTSAQSSDDNDEASIQPPAAPQIDKRPIHYAKGRLLSVDCSPAPAAIVSVAVSGKTIRLRTADYKSLMLVGEDTFSCDWTNRAVSVNYKAGGKADGDLISLEVH
ncbi:MAG: hypothetical protein JOZ80_16465 [Acidobacteriaceae bacterium]|nr:hypothetical protein [Acidobacteriaceae bacterium]